VTGAINQRDAGIRGSSRELVDGAAQLGNPKIIAQVNGIKARFLRRAAIEAASLSGFPSCGTF